MNTKKEFRLDVTLCLAESLFEGQGLSMIEEVLRQEAEPWISEIHIWKEGEQKRHEIRDFTIDVRDAATARGASFVELLKEHGPGSHARRTGSVELRGADDAMIVVLKLDDYRFSPSGGRWLWGNTVSIQLCAPHVANLDAVELARRIATRACVHLSPLYARGHFVEEWVKKNISREGGGMMAVGLDASRYLPGLYWMNFFGHPYCALLGKERLLSSPAHEAREVDAGVLLYITPRPEDWVTLDYESSEAKILSHVGQEYFFDAREPHKETAAPEFGLKPLRRNPRFS